MKIDYSKPVVRSFNLNVSKKWYVYYRVFNPMKGIMETFRDYSGLHSIKNVEKRFEIAYLKCAEIHEKLKSGWRPYDLVQSENMLAYSTEKKIYKQYVNENSVEAVASEYLRCVKITDSMRQEFLSKVRGFVAWLKSKRFNDIQFSLIDNKMIVTFFQFLIDDLELSATTVKKYKNTLMALWDFAIGKKYAFVNVVTSIPYCDRVKDEAAKPIRKDDLKRIMEMIMRDPQLELACKLELFCFLRPGNEIRKMKIGMIDFANSVINLPADIVKNTNPKKQRPKTTTIPDHLLFEMIDKFRLDTYPNDYYVFGKCGIPGTEHLGKNTLRTRFRNIRECLKLPHYYKLYSFKHTGISLMIDMNFHPNEIAQQAGWTNTYMLEVYVRHKEKSANLNIRENFKLF